MGKTDSLRKKMTYCQLKQKWKVKTSNPKRKLPLPLCSRLNFTVSFSTPAPPPSPRGMGKVGNEGWGQIIAVLLCHSFLWFFACSSRCPSHRLWSFRIRLLLILKWDLHMPLPQGIITFSSAECPRGCRVGICSGTLLCGLQGNTCSNMACPTGFQGISAPAPATLLPLLLPCPWSWSCFSHTLRECSSHWSVAFCCFPEAFSLRHCHPGWAVPRAALGSPHGARLAAPSPETLRPLPRVTTGLTVRRKTLKQI